MDHEIRLTVAGRVKSVYVPGPRTRERDREVELLRRKLVLAYGLSRGVGEVPELLDWLAAHAEALRVEGRRENTLYQYGRYMALVEAYLGNPRLDRLTPEALEGFFYRLVAQGYSRSVVLHVRHFLHAALERAVRYGYLGVNPVELTQTPKLPSREAGREIGEEELIRILEVARGHRLFAAFYLLAAYGLRRGEVLGLMWPDVDFEKGLLHIRRALVRSAATGKPFLGPTKTSRSNRVLPLTEEAAEVLFSAGLSAQALDGEASAASRSLLTSWGSRALAAFSPLGSRTFTASAGFLATSSRRRASRKRALSRMSTRPTVRGA